MDPLVGVDGSIPTRTYTWHFNVPAVGGPDDFPRRVRYHDRVGKAATCRERRRTAGAPVGKAFALDGQECPSYGKDAGNDRHAKLQNGNRIARDPL